MPRENRSAVGEIPRPPMEESPARGAGDGGLGMTTTLLEPAGGRHDEKAQGS